MNLSLPRARAVAAIVGAVAAGTLAACSGSPAAAPTTPTSSSAGASSSATPSASASTVAPKPVPVVSKPIIDDSTLAILSKKEAESAYTFSTDLGAKFAFDPALMARQMQNLTPADFEDLRAAMTPAAQKRWDKSVAGLPSNAAHQAVNELATVGVNINGNRLRPKEPVTRYVIAGGVLAFEGGDVSTVQTQTAVVHLIDRSGALVKSTVTKTVTLDLVKDGDGWKIDGWATEIEPWVVTSDT